MKKISMIFILVFFSMVSISLAGSVTVSTFGQLQAALTTAASNNENDIINIAAGLPISVTSLLEYDTSENYSLDIIGAGAGETVLDGGDLTQIMYVRAHSGVTEPITIKGITFQNAFSDSDGGGLFLRNDAGDVTVEGCEFLDNKLDSADDGGGAYIQSHTSISVSACSFIGNSSEDEGGGLYAYGRGLITITYSVFRSNTVADAYGGGLYVFIDDTAVANIINNTITGNTANDWGGGLLLDGGNGSTTFNVYNNIIWGNTSTNQPDSDDMYIFDGAAVVINLYNNDIGPYLRSTEPPQSTLNTGGNINADPMFDADFQLMPNSPCINSGLGGEDMGAYEYLGSSASIPTMNEWGMIIFSLLLGSFAIWYMRKQTHRGKMA